MPPKKCYIRSRASEAKRKVWISKVKSRAEEYQAATGLRYTSDRQLDRYGATAKSLARPGPAFVQPVDLMELEERQASVPAAQLAIERERLSQALLVAAQANDIKLMAEIMREALEVPVSLKREVLNLAELVMMDFCVLKAIPLERYPFSQEAVDHYLRTHRA